MEKIITATGNEYILMPKEYIDEIKLHEPTSGIFSHSAQCHLLNCGYIICYPDFNEFFNIYKPIDNEYEEEEVYQELEGNKQAVNEHMSFKTFRALNESKKNEDAIKDFANWCLNDGYLTVQIINKYGDFTSWYKDLVSNRRWNSYNDAADKLYAYLKTENKDKADLLPSHDRKKTASGPRTLTPQDVENIDIRNLYKKVWEILGGVSAKKENAKSIDEYSEFEQQAIENILIDYLSKYGNATVHRWYSNLTWSAQERLSDKMLEYKSKGSDPYRIARDTLDHMKVLWRYYWCKNNWPEAVDAFKARAYEVIYEDHKANIARKVEQYEREAEAERLRQIKFEEDVNSADTSKFAPKERDWEKMIDYMQKKSDPNRLATSCKDANKVVARFIIAKALQWDKCAEEFKKRAIDLGVATAPELEAYARKYAQTNIPDQWAEYIEELKADTKGGINMIQNGDDSINLNQNIIKTLDAAYNVESYKRVRFVDDPNYMATEISRYSGKKLYLTCFFGQYKRRDRWGGSSYTAVVKCMLLDHLPARSEYNDNNNILYFSTIGEFKSWLSDKVNE